ncbi:MAG: DUF2891 family protein, partial [Planctomycetota bacterium]
MRSILSTAVLAAALAVSAPWAMAQNADASPAPAQEAGAAKTTDAATLRASLGRLRDLMRAGIEQKEPSANVWTRSGHATVFDGSYDWHSCIAAHWALLSMSRSLRDAETAKWTLARLPSAALQQELALLASAEETSASNTSALFRPYADAWLLLLLDEMTRHDGIETAAIAKLRNDAEAALLTRLELSAFPEVPPSAHASTGTFRGDYQSFLFGYLAMQLVAPSSDAMKARRDALRTEKLEPMRSRLLAGQARGPRDFLDLGAILRILEVREGTAGTAPAQPSWTPLPD